MKTIRWGALAAALATALASGSVLAESTYGYASSGTGTISATAKVNLSVTVAKLILLRVGSASGTADTMTWSVGQTIPGVPTTPANGNGTAVNWDGTAPTVTTSADPAAINVYAWTNATTPSINCSMGAWSGAGGPTNANFSVTVTGTLPHPGANLGACASTAFPANTLAAGTWRYALGGTPGSWSAGTYTNTITYTAQGL
jgi:hypothetical protein